MKDAARLVAYLAATTLLGALLAPPIFWAAQWLVSRGLLVFLQRYDFQSFFHRALLVSAALLLWPLLKALRVRRRADLGLARNGHAGRDTLAGFLIAAVPLLCCGAVLVACSFYGLRKTIPYGALIPIAAASAVVPIIEESLFRGLLLGVLLRSNARTVAIVVTSALFSIIHFLKAPDAAIAPADVSWSSGFASLENSFWQFHDPLLVLAGFTTLFLIACVLADGRIVTRSLWLPIGLHAGWIFSNGLFNKVARRGADGLPWIGKNLLVGLVPLGVALLSWGLMRAWLSHVEKRDI